MPERTRNRCSQSQDIPDTFSSGSDNRVKRGESDLPHFFLHHRRELANFAIDAILSVKAAAKGGNTMATLNISMPDEMRAFIEARVSTGEYQSASDYLRDLIRHDREETERLLVEGLESGTARPLDMTTLRKKAQTLLKQEKAL
jgi:antitoxin ParD1/3/4